MLTETTTGLVIATYERAEPAAERLHRAIVAGTRGEKRLLPSLRPYDAILTRTRTAA